MAILFGGFANARWLSSVHQPLQAFYLNTLPGFRLFLQTSIGGLHRTRLISPGRIYTVKIFVKFLSVKLLIVLHTDRPLKK
jgi:hypothetical protein